MDVKEPPKEVFNLLLDTAIAAQTASFSHSCREESPLLTVA